MINIQDIFLALWKKIWISKSSKSTNFCNGITQSCKGDCHDYVMLVIYIDEDFFFKFPTKTRKHIKKCLLNYKTNRVHLFFVLISSDFWVFDFPAGKKIEIISGLLAYFSHLYTVPAGTNWSREIFG